MSTHTTTDVASWRDAKVIDASGDKIGSVSDVYEDRETGAPAWLAISTGLFGSKVSFAPIEGAVREGDGDVQLPYSKDQVKDAPNVEADGELSESEERELYAHYERDFGSFDYDAGREPVGHDTSGPSTDDAITRSEEELRVGKERHESGRARLRKVVVTEQQTATIPVSHEEVVIEREPITDANRGDATSGPEISEEEHEVVLHAETPVVDKQVVAKVRLDTETVTEDAQVSDEVRKERIETDGDVDLGSRR